LTDQQLKRNNHYVPIWYQRRFFTEDKAKFYLLDLDPLKKQLPDGRIVPVGREVSTPPSPKSCFCLNDLYTTQFGTILNDEIERYLFEEIDNKGAKAVRSFSGDDLASIHELFQAFFEYLDAQKLRTPKGLDWIKSVYPDLTQLELMLEMQGLRQMHCTMWSESVREIVSAEQSDVKFIVTDHPVTVYNAAYSPESIACSYPADPPIELIGTQTVFALDANHCLILTNLEYAKHPISVTLTAPRTNARYRGQSLVRTDAFIRTRKLTRDEVVAINYLLKRRARKYVAAGDKEWLYPERMYAGEWDAIGKILLPRDDLWQFGGEIYVGRADGSTYYQDEFGRTSVAHQYLQKEVRSLALGPNDLCGCGSGRKYKKCCKDVPEHDRPSWTVCNVRERNLMFCRAVSNILELNNGKTWDDVRRELSDEQVKRIHETFASLWSIDTDIANLLPRPDRDTFRAVYLGALDPRTVAANVTGWLAYIDELILPHPFVNSTHIRREYSPVQSPVQHKEQTLKNVLLLLILEPYIHAGIVHLVADPTDFNDEFRRTVWHMAKERTANWKFDDNDMEQFRKLADDDLERSIKRLPESSLQEYVRQHSPGLNGEQINLIVAEMKAQLANDPYALLQPVAPGEEGAQLRIVKGFNLEIAMFLAGLTGSVVYTDISLHWQHLHAHTRAAKASQPDATWQPIIDVANSIAFPIILDWHAGFQARVAGKFGRIRRVINDITKAIHDRDGNTRASQLAMELKRVEESMHREWSTTMLARHLDGHIEFSIPTGGFESNAVRRLLLTFGRAKDVRPITMAMFIRTKSPRRHDDN